jgi:hypothetical protein
VVCGQDCSDRKRVKDRLGRYYCQPCHEAQKARLAAAAAQTPAQPTPAEPSRPAAPPPPARAEGNMGSIFNLMADAEASAPASGPPAVPGVACPSCRSPMAAGAVLCVSCGYDTRTGKVLGGAKAQRRPAPMRRPGAGGGMSMSWLVGVVPAVILLVLAAVLRGVDGGVDIYRIASGIFGLAVMIWVLSGAFSDSTASGFLCLCVPFYAVYWVFAKNQSAALKWAYAASWVASIGGIAIIGFDKLAR